MIGQKYLQTAFKKPRSIVSETVDAASKRGQTSSKRAGEQRARFLRCRACLGDMPRHKHLNLVQKLILRLPSPRKKFFRSRPKDDMPRRNIRLRREIMVDKIFDRSGTISASVADNHHVVYIKYPWGYICPIIAFPSS